VRLHRAPADDEPEDGDDQRPEHTDEDEEGLVRDSKFLGLR
jgi:hypothetical protein